MSVYRTINSSFWTDPKVRALPKDGKLLMLYLISCPHAHVGGIYYLPEVTIAHETGLAGKGIDTLWDTLSESGLVWRDKKAEVVWVVNMLRYQGHGKKVYASVANQLRSLHKSNLINKFLQKYPAVAALFKDRVSIGIPAQDESGNQEQEQEQKQEQDKRKGAATAAAEFVIAVPVELETPEVHAALARWLAYKRKRRQPYKDPSHIETKLGEFAAHGPAAFVAAVNSSIGNNWAGLFPPKEGSNGKSTVLSPGKSYDPNATGVGDF